MKLFIRSMIVVFLGLGILSGCSAMKNDNSNVPNNPAKPTFVTDEDNSTDDLPKASKKSN